MIRVIFAFILMLAVYAPAHACLFFGPYAPGDLSAPEIVFDGEVLSVTPARVSRKENNRLVKDGFVGVDITLKVREILKGDHSESVVKIRVLNDYYQPQPDTLLKFQMRYGEYIHIGVTTTEPPFINLSSSCRSNYIFHARPG